MSVVAPDHRRVGSFSVGRQLRSISLDPAGHVIAATLDEGASLLDFQGRTLRTISGWLVDAWFDQEGRLWTIARGSSAHDASVSLYERADQGQPILRVRLADPFGGSNWLFPNSIRPEPVPVWLTAGEDGQAIYWIETISQGLRATLQDDFEFCTPPRMNPAGNGFLLLAEGKELRWYTFPGLELIASLDLPPGTSGADARLLSEDEALVTTTAGIVYLIGLRAMSIQAEIRVAGHDELTGIIAAGNHLVSMHHDKLVRWAYA